VARFTHRDLIVWQKAQDLAFEIIELADAMLSRGSAQVVARQIIRSASSIAANIAEGHGRFTSGANANHLLIARGSAAETDSWLDMLRRMKAITPAKEAELCAKTDEVIAMLTSMARSLQRSPKLREQRS
jgi:four helix bundle protein